MSAAPPNKWLKLKTRQLIKACGGLEEASRACEAECRPYSVPHLSRCQNADQPDFLPIDIVHCLQDYCGQDIVTSAMSAARPTAVQAGCLRDEVSDFIERGAEISKAVRAADGDGVIDAREGAAIADLIDKGFADLTEARVALDARMKPRTAGAA